MHKAPLGLVLGATYPIRALILLLRTPRLWAYIAVPILVNVILGILLYTGGLWLGFQGINALLTDLPIWTGELSHRLPELAPHWTVQLPQWVPQIHWTLPHPTWMPQVDWTMARPTWLPPLPDWQFQLPSWVSQLPDWGLIAVGWLIRLVLVLVLLVATGFVLLQFGVILGAPWYGKLSEELEKMRTGTITLVEVGVAQDIGRAIAYELKKIVLGVSVGVGLLLLNLIPGLGTAIATLGGIALTVTVVCMDFMDAAVERRRPGFRTKLTLVWQGLPATGSFGLVCLTLISIPLLNLLVIPICVAAGTLFFCDWVLPTTALLPAPAPLKDSGEA